MASDQVPPALAAEVAAFVWARAHDPLPRRARAEDLDRRWSEMGLVRDHQAAVEEGRAVTADNLAYTLLTAAARYREHHDYRVRWQAWTPFGDLSPGSDIDGPTAAQDGDEGADQLGT